MNMFNEITDYFAEVKKIIEGISKEDINNAIQILNEARLAGKKIFIIGNGGSASTATHFACDLNKYTSVEGEKRFKALSLEDNIPLLTALVNDEGWDKVYSYQLENLMDDGDYLVVISVHGGAGKDKAGLWSQNLTLAAKMIHDRGGKVIGLVGFDGGAIKSLADACITVPINSTPHVEGFHLILTHMICSIIKDQLSTNE
jgi:D-sedoheptulose 7-phosphate isomerase|tara:strand:- start:472 stop:1074 length:603 start_codon:yes stop_codon:yes gene_type:complete